MSLTSRIARQWRASTPLRKLVFLTLEGFCLFSVVRFSLLPDRGDAVALAAVTLALVCLPSGMEMLFSCRLAAPVWVCAALYATGSLLGHGYHLYRYLSWWDLLLHFAGGFFFALFALALLLVMEKGHTPGLATQLLFALCFSIALAAVWEFFEFGADRLFAMDMQDDTLIPALHSYLLGPEMGVVGHMDPIESVIVNGVVLPGYIDAGLFDTMYDMMVETAGAAVFAFYVLLAGRKHPLLRRK